MLDDEHLVDAADLFDGHVGVGLERNLAPPRKPSSAVIRNRDLQSSMRPASGSGEKPPNTTEWMAPIRAQASMA